MRTAQKRHKNELKTFLALILRAFEALERWLQTHAPYFFEIFRPERTEDGWATTSDRRETEGDRREVCETCRPAPYPTDPSPHRSTPPPAVYLYPLGKRERGDIDGLSVGTNDLQKTISAYWLVALGVIESDEASHVCACARV